MLRKQIKFVLSLFFSIVFAFVMRFIILNFWFVCAFSNGVVTLQSRPIYRIYFWLICIEKAVFVSNFPQLFHQKYNRPKVMRLFSFDLCIFVSKRPKKRIFFASQFTKSTNLCFGQCSIALTMEWRALCDGFYVPPKCCVIGISSIYSLVEL